MMLPKGAPWYVIVLIFTAIAIFSIIIFNFLRVTLLKKYKIKKSVLFILMTFMLFMPLLFQKFYTSNVLIPYVQVIVFSVLMLIYLETAKIDRENKNKPVVGRPKAKPNRAKNDNK
ncbi:hypothetical protein Q428_03715 [Fervidicella metallireducens AeB]|uniref:Uncharacterized protein n=1 Tax=Fervidicella metallireducens AeB TaxID=1403537 RepID=A0A017RXD3_9CLOT|nr:hypothetical protein [Fervidicella metallireducens]EYE89251.1 hypothetical protein Q428_03715 [Fervidicella metallireducens AeB]